MENKNDHDLLIELNTRVNLWHQEIMRVFEDHLQEDARQFKDIGTKVNAAHDRLDDFNEKLESFVSMKDKILGGAAALGFLFSAIIGVISIFKK